MDNTEINKFPKEISYNTYLNIKKSLLLSSFGSGVASIYLQIPNELKLSFTGISTVAAIAYLIMIHSNSVAHTRELKEINNLYQEFIKNYNELNKVFHFDNPIEIFTMFIYLTYHGYLSVDKKFEFYRNQTRDIKSMMGVNIILGGGVCRHLASMLTDILNDYNIEAGTMVVSSKNTIIGNNKDKYTEEEKDIIKIILGNHAITYAYKDGKSYYLDPTQSRTYQLRGKELFDSQIIGYPKLKSTILFNSIARTTNIKKRMLGNYPSVDIEEQERIKMETLDICKSNIDIFEQFYKENEELYNEAYGKVLSLNMKNKASSIKK